jgi:hypothetical protein
MGRPETSEPLSGMPDHRGANGEHAAGATAVDRTFKIRLKSTKGLLNNKIYKRTRLRYFLESCETMGAWLLRRHRTLIGVG